MKSIALVLCSLATMSFAQLPERPVKPPVHVPADATLFNGKWYRVYMDAVPWNTAVAKCKVLGGQLAVVPDRPTWIFLNKLAGEGRLWLGASDEKNTGRWQWIDGSPFTFKAWLKHQPDNNLGKEHYLMIWKGGWNDAPQDGKYSSTEHVVGYICEWKDTR